MLPFSHGELINYSKIASDCGVDSKTVKGYFEILVDTLLGDFILPYQKRVGRDIISRTPKFYLFDVGVAGALSQRKITTSSGEEFGKGLEHYILMELKAFLGYREINSSIAYWRTKRGLEVDFILDHGSIALEVKGSATIRQSDIRGLLAFTEEHAPKRSIVICNEPLPRKVGQIEFIPWKHFLEELWSGRIMK
jgi:predicted AAA+ superfamily ATPase